MRTPPMRFRRSFFVLAVLWAVSLPAAAQRGQPRAATDPAGAIAAFDRGVILHERGQLDAAIREYETAIRLDPTYYKTYNNLGNAYSDKGDLAHASPMYAKAIELNPNYALAHYNFGLLLQKIGDEGDAVRAFRKACAIDPRHPVFCSYADSVAAPTPPRASAAPPARAPITAQPNSPAPGGQSPSGLVGTTWVDDRNGEYEFLPNGVVRYTPDGVSYRGVWQHNGSEIYLKLNTGQDVKASIMGDRMKGEVWNNELNSFLGTERRAWTAQKQAPGASRFDLTFENLYVSLTAGGPPVGRIRAGVPVYLVFDFRFTKPGTVDYAGTLRHSDGTSFKVSDRFTPEAGKIPGWARPAPRLTFGKGEFSIFGEITRNGTTLSRAIRITAN